jgi:polar amino acid transport system substrate-binding protein
VFALTINAANIDNIKIMTENFPPYNMKVGKEVGGLSVEILEAMLKQMNSKLTKKDFKLLPWARGYSLVQKKKNHMLFSMSRTAKREKLFKWVGPIDSVKTSVIALKTNNTKISKVTDLNSYKVAASKDAQPEQYLLAHGVKKSNIVSKSGNNASVSALKMIKKGRIDFLVNTPRVVKYLANKDGIDFDKEFKSIFTLNKSDLYFAFSKDTSDDIVKEYQKALDAIKADGTYSKIIEKY